MEGVVIDTNVFVAAGFNSKSAAARVFEGVREGRFRLIWNEPTRRETEIIVRRIPRLDWASIADLFQPEAEFAGPVDLEAFTAISDPDDRKFAALSAAAKRPLVTNDNYLMADRSIIGIDAHSRAEPHISSVVNKIDRRILRLKIPHCGVRRQKD